jgi:SAM-dependent methyltransferase
MEPDSNSAESGSAGPDSGADSAATGAAEQIQRFWNADAEHYDGSPSHYPQRPQEQAAWAAALRRLLPEPPVKVLDMGAGTGFLALLLAAQGYQVTAADYAPAMLERLRAKAAVRGLAITLVETDAEHPPVDDFGAVVERHLMWTLPDPAAALKAWHAVAPTGRLVLVEGTWGSRGAPAAEQVRLRARQLARMIQPADSGHHGEYTAAMRSAVRYPDGVTPDELVSMVEASPWGRLGKTRIERLRDVEWAIASGAPLLESLIGAHPHWAVVAGR